MTASPKDGFVLVEVAVAMLIMALATVVILRTAGEFLAGGRDAQVMLGALSFARSRIALLEAGPLRPGRTTEPGEPFALVQTVTEMPRLEASDERGAGGDNIRLFRIGVRVEWSTAGRRRAVGIETIRTSLLPQAPRGQPAAAPPSAGREGLAK